MRVRLLAIAAGVCLAGQAWADDAQPGADSQSGYVTVTPHKPAQTAPPASPRHAKTHASRESAAAAQTNDAAPRPRPVPAPPQSQTSFTGGWKASSDQGNGFMGGLKIGF